MKKIVLLLVVFTGVNHLNAQQLMSSEHSDASTLLKYLKTKPGVTFPDTGLLRRLAPGTNLSNYINVNHTAFYSSMPVIKLDGNSKMPIANFDGYSRMPVNGLDIVNPALPGLKLLPDVSTFKTPY